MVRRSDSPLCERWRPHNLRRSLLTWLAERNPAVAKLQAGHVGGDVTLLHYVHPRIVKGLLDELPQPAAQADPQMKLF